jgi:hypothetical protein
VGVEAGGFLLEDLPSAVSGAVVNHNYLVRDAAEFQFEVQVLDGGRDAAFFVAGGDDDGEEAEWEICSHGRGIINANDSY